MLNYTTPPSLEIPLLASSSVPQKPLISLKPENSCPRVYITCIFNNQTISSIRLTYIDTIDRLNSKGAAPGFCSWIPLSILRVRFN